MEPINMNTADIDTVYDTKLKLWEYIYDFAWATSDPNVSEEGVEFYTKQLHNLMNEILGIDIRY